MQVRTKKKTVALILIHLLITVTNMKTIIYKYKFVLYVLKYDKKPLYLHSLKNKYVTLLVKAPENIYVIFN